MSLPFPLPAPSSLLYIMQLGVAAYLYAGLGQTTYAAVLLGLILPQVRRPQHLASCSPCILFTVHQLVLVCGFPF